MKKALIHEDKVIATFFEILFLRFYLNKERQFEGIFLTKRHNSKASKRCANIGFIFYKRQKKNMISAFSDVLFQ